MKLHLVPRIWPAGEGVAVSHPQARLWLYQGVLSRVEEKPRMAVRRLRRSQHLTAPPEVGEAQLTDGLHGA